MKSYIMATFVLFFCSVFAMEQTEIAKKTYTGHAQDCPIKQIVAIPQLDRIVVISQGGRVAFYRLDYDIASKSISMRVMRIVNVDGFVNGSIAVAPNGQTLAVAESDKVRVYDYKGDVWFCSRNVFHKSDKFVPLVYWLTNTSFVLVEYDDKRKDMTVTERRIGREVKDDGVRNLLHIPTQIVPKGIYCDRLESLVFISGDPYFHARGPMYRLVLDTDVNHAQLLADIKELEVAPEPKGGKLPSADEVEEQSVDQEETSIEELLALDDQRQQSRRFALVKQYGLPLPQVCDVVLNVDGCALYGFNGMRDGRIEVCTLIKRSVPLAEQLPTR